jgi:hypothetical protein
VTSIWAGGGEGEGRGERRPARGAHYKGLPAPVLTIFQIFAIEGLGTKRKEAARMRKGAPRSGHQGAQVREVALVEGIERTPEAQTVSFTLVAGATNLSTR